MCANIEPCLCPRPVRLAYLGGGTALPHGVAGQAGDGGLAPEARALRPHLGLGGGGGRAAAERLAGEVWAVPANSEGSLSSPLSQTYLSHHTAELLWNRHLL